MIVEGKRPGEFLISEGEGAISRDSVTIAAGSVLEPGQVLGQVTATGEYKAFDPAATDGTQKAVAVLYDHVDASGGAVQAVAITRIAEVDGRLLTAADPVKAKADLAASHIIVR